MPCDLRKIIRRRLDINHKSGKGPHSIYALAVAVEDSGVCSAKTVKNYLYGYHETSANVIEAIFDVLKIRPEYI